MNDAVVSEYNTNMKLCGCGCGKSAPLASQNHKTRGWIKGQPLPFCQGHGRHKGKTSSLTEIFERHVVRHEDGCWEWSGVTTEFGYGVINYRGRTLRAHRVSWILANGEIPEGLNVCHSCDNPACSRLDHLFLGTDADNVADKVSKRRQHWGVRTPSSKLTPQQVSAIRQEYRGGNISQTNLGKRYGICQEAVRKLIRGITWRSVAMAMPLMLSLLAHGTTSVVGNVKNLGTGSVSAGTFVRFYLRGCSGNQPRINGTGIIAPTLGNVYYFDFVPNSSGAISGTLYSTRDAAGTGNGEIECGGSFTSVWYGMQVFVNGKAGPETPIHAKNTATIDVSNVTPITTNPVITAPTGDSTYARLDAGNTPFTGTIQAPSATFTGPLTAGSVTTPRPNKSCSVDGVTYTSITAALADTTNCILP